ncbi:hypothetical protein [Vibrio parahaemolyticus]|uniref:hypothetical protein n=1 Tax=Vibrio parahaemolyticus TaxID=670 RepID=UPI0011740647|nr:hypothetical protein [Vibrio parahaemolyticus]TOP96745.1 hypothetical protein CGH07_00365 [Vibrio parahaemolyticus]HCE1484558.1 hypothetical protein [Vibrio parahaemolyticus]HCG5272424.1 hypothetical protein [Vibrio parahaemolyticus]
MFDLDELISETIQEDVSELVCEIHNQHPKISYDPETSEIQVSGCCEAVISEALRLINDEQS